MNDITPLPRPIFLEPDGKLYSDHLLSSGFRQCHDSDTSCLSLYQKGYQQALDDFGIMPLLHHIQTHTECPTLSDAEAIAALLIQSLMTNLTGDGLTSYLNAIRHPPLNPITPLTQLHLSSSKTELPSTFPNVAPAKFQYGDRLRWTSPQPTPDRGMVIGCFYTFAPHRCHWHWSYLIWFDANSPSSSWINADIAWEDDLEPLESEQRN